MSNYLISCVEGIAWNREVVVLFPPPTYEADDALSWWHILLHPSLKKCTAPSAGEVMYSTETDVMVSTCLCVCVCTLYLSHMCLYRYLVFYCPMDRSGVQLCCPAASQAGAVGDEGSDQDVEGARGGRPGTRQIQRQSAGHDCHWVG